MGNAVSVFTAQKPFRVTSNSFDKIMECRKYRNEANKCWGNNNMISIDNISRCDLFHLLSGKQNILDDGNENQANFLFSLFVYMFRFPIGDITWNWNNYTFEDIKWNECFSFHVAMNNQQIYII